MRLEVNITHTKILSKKKHEGKEIENVDEHNNLGNKFKIDEEYQNAKIPRRRGQNLTALNKLGLKLMNRDVPMNLKKRFR